jgi:ferredoxin
MTYVISELCIGTKDTSCVEVCPVDCIHPTPGRPRLRRSQMLYMDPEECIDCDDCVEARPIDAITSKDEVPPEWQHFIEKNAALLPQRAAVTHGQSGPGCGDRGALAVRADREGLDWDVALVAFAGSALPAGARLLDVPRLAVAGKPLRVQSSRALLGSGIGLSRGVMERSSVGGQLAHPREQHIVLLVDVLVQIEFERGQCLEQRAVRPA